MIRRAVHDDAKALRAFACDSFVATYAEFNTPKDLSGYIEQHFTLKKTEARLAEPTMTTLLAELDGNVVGYTQFQPNACPVDVAGDWPAEMERLYVDANMQGRGVAQQLLDAVQRELAAGGATDLWLGVWQQNPRAIAFYEKSGFRRVGTTEFLFGSSRQTDWVMLREVESMAAHE